MSTQQLQQVTWHGRDLEAPITSKQQPGSFPQRRPVGVEARLAATVLAVLTFSLVLTYAAISAMTTRNGYLEMGIRQEIEDLRARNAALQYQLHVAWSGESVEETALRLGLHLADPVQEVDYVILPREMTKQGGREFVEGPARLPGAIARALAELADEVVTAAGSQAEASTLEGHRQ